MEIKEENNKNNKERKFSYAEYYKKKVALNRAEKLKKEFNSLGFQQKTKLEPLILKQFEERIEKDTTKAINFFTIPKHIKILKILFTILILLIVAFILYKNFISSEEFNYFYEVGGKKSYLTPLSRISEPGTIDNVNYINLTSGLVYFTVPIPRGSEKIKVQVRFQDNFPTKSFSLGGKDKPEWHYKWQDIYKNATPSQNQWKITETTFQLKDLYYKDNKLSMVFNVPHLNKLETQNYTIPIDWINITIYKPGLI